MLSYQHSFHAGNHADVLKHLVLTSIIKHIHKKPKAFFYADSHAGNGCYNIAAENTKYQKDLIPKSDHLAVNDLQNLPNPPLIIAQYLEIVAPYLSSQRYPGSPLLMLKLIENYQARNESGSILGNNVHFNELHPQAFEQLKLHCSASKAHLHKRDAFEFLLASLPPKPNRGCVLIDPPYEQAQEYEKVLQCLTIALNKWPQGIFAVWYPLLSPTRINRTTKQVEKNPKHGLSERMITNICGIKNRGALDIQFAVQSPSSSTGMYGSGMLIINPPWQLEHDLEKIITALVSHVQQDANTLSQVRFLTERA